MSEDGHTICAPRLGAETADLSLLAPGSWVVDPHCVAWIQLLPSFATYTEVCFNC